MWYAAECGQVIHRDSACLHCDGALIIAARGAGLGIGRGAGLGTGLSDGILAGLLAALLSLKIAQPHQFRVHGLALPYGMPGASLQVRHAGDDRYQVASPVVGPVVQGTPVNPKKKCNNFSALGCSAGFA